ncbi:hypothetical protein HAPG_00106, partial [Halorubrum phage GNf2]
MPPKHQGFVFTENNYDLATENRIKAFPWAKYVLFGKETAPTTGTPHLQGFIWTHEPKTKQQVTRLAKLNFIGVPGSEKGPAYWEEYCSKQDVEPYRNGIPPTEEEFQAQIPVGQGKRTDLLDVKRKIDEGKPVMSMLSDDNHFGAFAQHQKFFQTYQAHKRRRTKYMKPEVVVYHGPTATNKSKRVHDTIEDFDEFFKWEPHMTNWFDGYVGQKVVLFEEFRGQLPFGEMLSLLDGYPNTRVPFKGGFADWSPEKIYLTSPLS